MPLNNSEYEIRINENTLKFTIFKDGQKLPFEDFQNISWALQGALASIKRTEAEIKRREKENEITKSSY